MFSEFVLTQFSLAFYTNLVANFLKHLSHIFTFAPHFFALHKNYMFPLLIRYAKKPPAIKNVK